MKNIICEYGREWHDQVPRFSIGWLVDRYHVSTGDAEIEVNIRDRCHNAPNPPSPPVEEQCVNYALARHDENIRLYQSVMSSRLAV